MRNAEYFRNKRITIAGIARSGVACAELLSDLGSDVGVTDNQDNPVNRLAASRLQKHSIKTELGRHTVEFMRKSDLVIISPGVPDSADPVVWANEFKIPVISEIEAASILCPAPIIAITGTNGKTTVTTLIGRILEACGKKAFVCGNIGNPFSGELKNIQPDDFVSLEVSSFQLEHINTFKPKISVILNISRNHLDRYNNMQEYLDAKKRIYMNQGADDYVVLNSGDPQIRVLADQLKAKAVFFSQDKDFNPNQAAVLAVGSILGIDKDIIIKVFTDFKGVEHRLEEVAEINGIKFINDSKATTVDATIWALKSTPEPVVLIAGGREKGNDYNSIVELAKHKVKRAILIGEAREKIGAAFGGLFPVEEAASLEDAVGMAFLAASAGDRVLLSPMCKSFDMFRDYEDRGRLFKEAVKRLADSVERIV